MNEEIKEILDDLRTYKDRYEYYLFNNLSFSDRDYKAKILLNYITNLQEENEILKEENKHIFANVNDDELLISNAMNYAEAQDYKSRIDKAIEYIRSEYTITDDDLYLALYSSDGTLDKLENILTGGDEE